MKESWEYLPVLNSLIQVCLTICIGALAGGLRILQANEFVPQAVNFVFYICLPSLVIKGIGIGIDFYSEKNIWAYIVAFLILRAIALTLALSVVLFGNWKEKRRTKGLGHVAVLWLTLTWISTVILGVPISSAVFGNPKLGMKYGILAGISSFIFQLPLQLMFLECHAAEEEKARIPPDQQTSPHRVVSISQSTGSSSDVMIEVTPDSSLKCMEKSNVNGIPEGEDETEAERQHWWSLVHAEHISNRDLWLRITVRYLRNPVLWGIIIGFALSLSTAGKYLRCPSEDCILGLAWIGETLGWVGQCVSPISLFAMGLWMHQQGLRKLFAMRIFSLTAFMFSKLVVVPLIMVGLAKAMRLDDEAGRAAILIATLPISLASFSLGKKYNIGEEDLATNVATGTILMLPTVLIWNIVLDKVGLYPIASSTSGV